MVLMVLCIALAVCMVVCGFLALIFTRPRNFQCGKALLALSFLILSGFLLIVFSGVMLL